MSYAMADASSPKSNIISQEEKIEQMINRSPKPSKKTADIGVRVHHNGVYDSANRKACHQCRQKKMGLAVYCKNKKINKQCSMKYCKRCLLNRYGEKAEDVENLEDWSCPKCRRICNCSNCMKKCGYQPTGALLGTAKESGFSSVSELLQQKAPENFVHKKHVKDVGASAQKTSPLTKEMSIASARKRGKGNSFDGKSDINTNAVATNTVEENPVENSKKMIQEDLRAPQIVDEDGGDRVSLNRDTLEKLLISNKNDDKEENDSGIKDYSMESVEMDLDNSVGTKHQQDGGQHKKFTDSVMGYEAHRFPEGTELTMVAGAELAPEDVGDALQLLELCATFGKILNLIKGQPEAAVRELTSARSVRQKYSTSVQFLTQLLSILQSDSREMSPTASPLSDRSLWLDDLKKVISDSQCAMDPVLLDKLDGGYEALNVSQKLKIFNFLCDEILGTAKIRNWIDDQNSRYVVEKKELKQKLNGAKDKLRAAKDKVKQTKQKMLSEIEKPVNAENSSSLSSTEYNSILSKYKSEVAQARTEMHEIKGILSKKKRRSDAIRIEPIFVDDNGYAYWKLICYSTETDIICQDLGTEYISASDEKWCTYDNEQQKEIMKHISWSARKTRRLRVKSELPITYNESSA